MIKNLQLLLNKNRIAQFIARESGKDEEVILFGLRLFLTSAFGYGFLIVISALLGILQYSLAAAITVSVLRIFSGGAHASSQFRCNLIGIIIYVLLGFVAKIAVFTFSPILLYIVSAIFLLGVCITFIYVPADTPGKPISSKMQRTYLRAISFMILFAWFMLLISAYKYKFMTTDLILSSSLGILWQLASLTPPGYKIVGIADSFLKTILERRVRNETHYD